MLAPEVWNFPKPKVTVTHKENLDLESVVKTIQANYFYRTLVITCPDETHTPNDIQEIISEDTDYYTLKNCSLKEFVEPVFIEHFVKNGRLYCLSTNRDCIIQNCAAITPDGILTIHLLEYIYQTLSLDGIKRPHNFYEIRIDLKYIKNYVKLRLELNKLELFDFDLIWEPNEVDICPSSIAKYFDDKNIEVSVNSLKISNVTPTIAEVPILKDVDIEDMVEWVDMLAYEVDMTESDPYITTYSQPESENALKTTRISSCSIFGFIPPTLVTKLCGKLTEYVASRELENFWAAICLQSDENGLFQWSKSSPKMFQSHDLSCNVFFTTNGHILYYVGEVKYS